MNFVTSFGDRTGNKISLEVLFEDYIPENLLYREKHLQEIQFYLLQYKTKRTPDLLLIGPPATGKTLTIRYLLKDLPADHAKKILYAVAEDTTYKTLLSIARAQNISIPERGLGLDEVMNTTFAQLEKQGITTVVIDEANRIEDTGINDLAYRFSRGKISSICISNSMMFRKKITDVSALSSYLPSNIYFQPYTTEETRCILENRLTESNSVGYIDNECIAYISALVAQKNMDLRYAITLLRKTLEHCIMNKQNKATVDIIKEVEKSLDADYVYTVLEKLKPPQWLLLKIITAKKNDTISSIFANYNSAAIMYGTRPLSKTILRENLRILETCGYITTNRKSRGYSKGVEWCVEPNPELSGERIGQIVENLLRNE